MPSITPPITSYPVDGVRTLMISKKEQKRKETKKMVLFPFSDFRFIDKGWMSEGVDD